MTPLLKIKPGSHAWHAEILTTYYTTTTHGRILTADHSHCFTQCSRLKSWMPFKSIMKLNWIYWFPFNKFSDVSIKHIKRLQRFSFPKLIHSCTSLMWVLYFISIFLDRYLALNYPFKWKVKIWEPFKFQNETHMRASTLNTVSNVHERGIYFIACRQLHWCGWTVSSWMNDLFDVPRVALVWVPSTHTKVYLALQVKS